MCGFAGAFRRNSQPIVADEIVPMRESLEHRGPDDAGLYVSDSCGLGFRRLSIIDLDSGHQPVANEDGTIHAVLNGEIYNYRELRSRLKSLGHTLSTKSDSEVIVHLYEEYGIDFATHLRGMFAIAVFDEERDRLLLARDRMGIKPLFYLDTPGRLLFGSEIKALTKHPAMRVAPNLAAIGSYLALRYVPGDETWFEDVRKVAPGHLLIADRNGLESRRYWEMPYATQQTFASREEALGHYRDVFQNAVESHLISDVPIGLFLSGGMDSSALLAGIVDAGHDEIRCFSADFGIGGDVDETEEARVVARHFGVQHEVLTVGSADIDLLEKIVWHLDEPIGDPAVLPTYLLAAAAAKEVKVVITGEGSDEVNGGYLRDLRYQLFQENQGRIRMIDRLPAWLKRITPLGKKLEPWAAMLDSTSDAECFRKMAGYEFGEGLFDDSPLPDRTGCAELDAIARQCGATDALERKLFFDRNSFMLEDLIPKVDRMTMAHGLEARVPYLDHLFVESVGQIPARWRIDTKTRRTKSMLRDSMASKLPDSTLARGQHGFNVPLDRWFKSGLHEYMTGVLRDKRTQARGLLAPGPISRVADSIEATGKPAKSAWMIVMMELWFRRYID